MAGSCFWGFVLQQARIAPAARLGLFAIPVKAAGSMLLYVWLNTGASCCCSARLAGGKTT